MLQSDLFLKDYTRPSVDDGWGKGGPGMWQVDVWSAGNGVNERDIYNKLDALRQAPEFYIE
jgi:hypothetical protein